MLVLVALVLVYLGRTGRLQPARERVSAGIRTIRNTIRVRSYGGGYNVRYIFEPTFFCVLARTIVKEKSSGKIMVINLL